MEGAVGEVGGVGVVGIAAVVEEEEATTMVPLQNPTSRVVQRAGPLLWTLQDHTLRKVRWQRTRGEYLFISDGSGVRSRDEQAFMATVVEEGATVSGGSSQRPRGRRRVF